VSKDPLDKAADAIKKTVSNVTDAIHEQKHRSDADAERARRDLLGDELTPGEKAGSVANEAVDRTQAEIDAAKRKIRENT
jgi:hypothetical protein